MKGRGQPRAAKDPLSPARGEDGNVEPWRYVGVAQRSQLGEKVNIGRAATQEDVLAVINLMAGVGIRKGESPASQEGPLLHQRNRVAAISEVAGGGHSRQPTAYDDYLPEALAAIPFTHSLAISMSFSLALRLTLLPKTS